MIQDRREAFGNVLTLLGIPYVGLSGGPPFNAQTVTIQFAPEATQEQRDFANNYKDNQFDWRPHRFVSTPSLVNLLASATVAQRNQFTLWVLANWIQDNEPKVREALAAIGFTLPFDEVAP